MKKVFWLILFVLLAGCGGDAPAAETAPAASATAVPPAPPTQETIAEAEVVPADTAVPATATATTASPTVTPVPTATLAPRAVPALVWLPYATGNYGQPVLMLENDQMALRELPVAAEIFFEYEAGWLAYGSEFWGATANQQSVTNLHIYDFATETDEQWAEWNIGRAAISPASGDTDPLTVAVAVHFGEGFTLFVFSLPRSSFPLIDDIDPYFSWSPDGDQIAYLRDGELFITSSRENSGNPPIASGVYQDTGWIGDAPLWLGESGYLLYADAPFTIVAADGSETIVPTATDGTALQGPRPFAMLYAPTTNQLIAESEGMFGPSVVVYQLGDGFETAELVEQIDDAQLAGWQVENESVVIVSGGEPTILPLTRQE